MQGEKKISTISKRKEERNKQGNKKITSLFIKRSNRNKKGNRKVTNFDFKMGDWKKTRKRRMKYMKNIEIKSIKSKKDLRQKKPKLFLKEKQNAKICNKNMINNIKDCRMDTRIKREKCHENMGSCKVNIKREWIILE